MKIKLIMSLIISLAFAVFPAFSASVPFPDKSKDKVLQSMIEETLP